MVLELYPSFLVEGQDPPPAGPEIDGLCQGIADATKGFGTNEKALLLVMGKQTPEDRCKVHLRYKAMFDKVLKSVIEDECGRKPFGRAMKYLSVPPDIAECIMLNEACKGIGTNEMLMVSIVCGRSNKEMVHLKKVFFDCYQKDLGAALGSEIRGTLEALVFNCLQATMAEEGDAEYNDAKMADDIEALYKMGQGKFGTDEKGLFKILCSSPPEYLKKLNMAYAEKHGLTLEHALGSELKGISKDAAQFLVGMKFKPHETIAKLFDEACKGAGTDETLMASILIRYQLVMKQVMLAHVELFGKTMADRTRQENRGVDEALFLELLAVGDA